MFTIFNSSSEYLTPSYPYPEDNDNDFLPSSENSFEALFKFSFPEKESNTFKLPFEENDSIKILFADSKTNEEKVINKSETNNTLGKKTKRGRKKNSEKEDLLNSSGDINLLSRKKIHGKTEKFNVLNKIKVDSINSLINCTNCILAKFYKKEKFLNINAKYKRNVNNKELKSIQDKKLYEIITEQRSNKYSKYPVDYNLQLYQKIKSIPECKYVINFLNENFSTFFQEIYYKKEKTINLTKYGINEDVELSKKMKLIDKIKNFDDKECGVLCNKYINQYFFKGKLMFYIGK